LPATPERTMNTSELAFVLIVGTFVLALLIALGILPR
jgi:hypothetical protein